MFGRGEVVVVVVVVVRGCERSAYRSTSSRRRCSRRRRGSRSRREWRRDVTDGHGGTQCFLRPPVSVVYSSPSCWPVGSRHGFPFVRFSLCLGRGWLAYYLFVGVRVVPSTRAPRALSARFMHAVRTRYTSRLKTNRLSKRNAPEFETCERGFSE